jgi:hypothetical protein
MREETFLGDKAIVKVKHKQPGKDESLQNNIDNVCIIAGHGQEPELVPKPMPGADQEPIRDIKSEREPGQKRDRETQSNRFTNTCHPCYSKSTDSKADCLNRTPDAIDGGEPDERSQLGQWALTHECPNYANHQMIDQHQPLNSDICTCFVFGCQDKVDSAILKKVRLHRLSISGCTEKWKY